MAETRDLEVVEISDNFLPIPLEILYNICSVFFSPSQTRLIIGLNVVTRCSLGQIGRFFRPRDRHEFVTQTLALLHYPFPYYQLPLFQISAA